MRNRRQELSKLAAEDPGKLVELVLSWEETISEVMPKDFKSWWQNIPEEWPLVTKLVIESLREREASAMEYLERAVEDLNIISRD